jgi:uncharacterized protein (TIGR03067 family)
MKSELEKLQGTWDILTLEMEGRTMPAGGQIEVKGNRFTALSMGATYRGTITIGGSGSLRTIDLKFTAGPEKGNTNRGIFEFQGDIWRLCLNLSGKERPTEFASRPNSGLALETLRRAEKAAAARASKPAPEPHWEPAPELEGQWAMVSCVSSGQPLEERFVKLGRRKAKGNEITVLMAGKVIVQAKFTVDRSQNPMTIDYFLKGGRSQLGIYQLDGQTLKVNYSSPGQPRPTEFTTSAGDGRTLTVWRLIQG